MQRTAPLGLLGGVLVAAAGVACHTDPACEAKWLGVSADTLPPESRAHVTSGGVTLNVSSASDGPLGLQQRGIDGDFEATLTFKDLSASAMISLSAHSDADPMRKIAIMASLIRVSASLVTVIAEPTGADLKETTASAGSLHVSRAQGVLSAAARAGGVEARLTGVALDGDPMLMVVFGRSASGAAAAPPPAGVTLARFDVAGPAAFKADDFSCDSIAWLPRF